MDLDIIDLNEYDLSYDIQFVAFMITLLDPYIYFDPNKENKIMVPDGDGIRPERIIKIYKKKNNHLYKEELNHALNINSKQEELNYGQFIEFIQHTFPDIINDQLKMNTELFREENIKCKIFRETYLNNFNEYKYRFDDNKEEYTKYCKYFQNMNKEGIMNRMNYYEPNNFDLNNNTPFRLKTKELQDKINYLKEIKKINRDRNGSIKDVLQFLENLKYFYY